jgi:hypothetical protein
MWEVRISPAAETTVMTAANAVSRTLTGRRLLSCGIYHGIL